MSSSQARLRALLALALLLTGLGALGFAAFTIYTDVRYPLGALKASDIQGLRVEMATLPKGPHLHVTGTIADNTLAVRRVFAGHIRNAMWLKIYPVSGQEVGSATIDLRMPLRPGATELRFGSDKELIWRSSP